MKYTREDSIEPHTVVYQTLVEFDSESVWITGSLPFIIPTLVQVSAVNTVILPVPFRQELQPITITCWFTRKLSV